jgi:type I restriction-modification system DNA methylase subunit
MIRKHTDNPSTFSQQVKPGNACSEQYTPVGVLAALAQLGDSPNSDAADPCCGSGLIVSAEMLNRAHAAAA